MFIHNDPKDMLMTRAKDSQHQCQSPYQRYFVYQRANMNLYLHQDNNNNNNNNNDDDDDDDDERKDKDDT